MSGTTQISIQNLSRLAQNSQKRKKQQNPGNTRSIKKCNTSRLMSFLESCVNKSLTSVAEEIGKYLKVKLNSKDFKFNDFMMPLKWWKAHSNEFPTLDFLAHYYLSCVGSSCSVKHLFLVAADVCTSNQGRLLPSTMSQCLNNMIWLKEGVKLPGEFKQAGTPLEQLFSSK